ncbi:MAG: GxxExxY protein [Lentisphaerae bacterium]|nr:GxxExxY protein [Lentisphaerota bacterium]
MVNEINQITGEIIGAAIEVHRILGPGLLESVYQSCMETELLSREVAFAAQVPVTVTYKDHLVASDGFRLDLLVRDCVVVELKSVEEVRDVHKKQLLTYRKLTRNQVGLLINFNVSTLREGITRVVNEYVADAG